ncbi:MAG: hypothetical protein EOO14_09040 [Chitinophagaceae bacterium]|nr:MAG: hypothetical protein EOO14_09040 [Chitinophagaceae bacterium]
MKHPEKTTWGRLVILVAGLLLSVSSFAQLKEVGPAPDWQTVGEVKWLKTTKARLQYIVQKSDTAYWLYLKDEKVLRNNRDMPVINYFSIRFRNEGAALQALETLLFSFFEGEGAKDKAYEKTFLLGNTMVMVQHSPKIIGKAIMLTTKEGSVILTKNELKKLFGRDD